MTLVRQPLREASSAWDAKADALLADGIRALDLPTTAAQRQQFHAYGELLLKWNGTYNLLGATSSRAIIQDHLLDSVAVHPVLNRWLRPRQTVVDVGSGAGFPGIVLGIMDPERPFVLVEPIGKKAAFLRQVLAAGRLTNVRVFEGRIEAFERGPSDTDQRQQAHTLDGPPARHFICRAFTSLEHFAQLCAAHASEHSLFFAMKAARVGEELKEMGSSIEVLAVEALSTAGKAVQRHLVVMRTRHADVASNPLRSV